MNAGRVAWSGPHRHDSFAGRCEYRVSRRPVRREVDDFSKGGLTISMKAKLADGGNSSALNALVPRHKNASGSIEGDLRMRRLRATECGDADARREALAVAGRCVEDGPLGRRAAND